MSSCDDDDHSDFHALMTGVKRIKDQHAHASSRSKATLYLNLRRDPDHRLAHLSRPDTVHVSSRQLDGSTLKKIKQGKYPLDATLDLHGMTLDKARIAFRRLIADSVSCGHRCLLVITGKGDLGQGTKEAPARGHIRRALPDWGREKPLDYLVLDIVPAAPVHGGAGAFYVVLRRDRQRNI